jgi:autotransporter-associated beta strand protein
LTGGNSKFYGVIANGANAAVGLTLNASGNGSQYLMVLSAQTNAMTYTGPTIINGGLLEYSRQVSYPSTSSILINPGGSLAAQVIPSTNNSAVTSWLSQTVGGNPLVVKSSSGSIALISADTENINMYTLGYPNLFLGAGGSENYTGTLTPYGNTYLLGGGGSLGTLTYKPAITTVAATAGTTAYVVIGGGQGTVNLSSTGGNNTYAGGTTVNMGDLEFGTAGSDPGGVGSITINSGGGLLVAGAYTTVDSWLATGQIATSSSGAIVLTANNSETISMKAVNGSGSYGYPTLSLGASYNLAITFSGALTPYGNTYYLGGGGGVLIYNPPITGAGNSLELNGGPGIVVLPGSNANSFGGGVIINTGVLQIGNQTSTGSGAVQVNTFCGLTFMAGNDAVSLGGLTGSGSMNLQDVASTPAAVALTVGGNNDPSDTFSGNLNGPGSFIKTGNGAQILSGPSNYTGGSIVNSGTLVVANSTGSALGTGNVTMNGGVLASTTTGTIFGSVLPGSGTYTIAPGGGGSIGTLTIGGWTISNSATLALDPASTPAGSGGLLVITGPVTYTGTANITLSSSPTTLGDYKLIDDTYGSPNVADFTLQSAAPSGKKYTLSTSTSDGSSYLDLVVANSSVLLAATANATVSNPSPTKSATFGTAVTTPVANGATYAGLASYVNAVSPSADDSLSFGTTASISAGTASGAATVSFAWRTRAPNESSAATATSPPMGYSGAHFLASDVLQLSGLATSGTVSDAYALSLSYSAATVGTAAPYLATLMPSGYWENAVNGNSTGTPTSEGNEPLATFLTNTVGANPLANYVGYYGYDTTADTAWAILNFQSDLVSGNYAFAVVPEPGTIVLLLAGGLAMLPVLRRRLRRA